MPPERPSPAPPPAPPVATPTVVATISYEGATLPALVAALRAAGVTLLVDVRAAARAGRHAAMHAIFRDHLATAAAQNALAELAALVAAARVCLLCFEADPQHCHRLLVADALAERMPVAIRHLHLDRAAAD